MAHVPPAYPSLPICHQLSGSFHDELNHHASLLEPSPYSQQNVIRLKTDEGHNDENLANIIFNYPREYDKLYKDFNQTLTNIHYKNNLSACNPTLISIGNIKHDSSSPTTPTTSSIFTPNNLEPIDEFFPELVHTNKIHQKASTSILSSSKSLDSLLKRKRNRLEERKRSLPKRNSEILHFRAKVEYLYKENSDLKKKTNSLEKKVEDYKKVYNNFAHSYFVHDSSSPTTFTNLFSSTFAINNLKPMVEVSSNIMDTNEGLRESSSSKISSAELPSECPDNCEKNNLMVQKSLEQSKAELLKLQNESLRLEQQNRNLKARIERMEKQIDDYEIECDMMNF